MRQERGLYSFALEHFFVRWDIYEKLYNFNSISPDVRVKVDHKQRKRNMLWIQRINSVLFMV
jgi:ribosomal protein L20